jgi:YD repeat-containing protein
LYDAQRLVGVKSGDRVQVRYQYDHKGRKSAIESYDSQPLARNTAYAPHWEGTDLGFATHLGRTVTTLYNEQGVATGAEFRDAEGKLLGHIVRKFDAEGRVVAEEQFADAPRDFMLPEEIRSKLNAEQIKAVGAFAGSVENRANSYSYDAQGRVTERHRSGGPFGDEVTIIKYNDHGDNASERTTVMNPEAGRQYTVSEAGTMIPVGQPQAPQPPAVYETQYTYQYDAYGNWTELTTATAVPAYYFPSVASLAIRAAAWLASSPKWTCRKCRSYMPRIRALFLSVFPSILSLKLAQDEQRIEIKLSSGVDSTTNSGFFMLHSFPTSPVKIQTAPLPKSKLVHYL